MKNFTEINDAMELELQTTTNKILAYLSLESEKAGHEPCPTIIPLTNRSVSGMDMNIVNMPGVFSFQKLSGGKKRTATKKEYVMDYKGKYVEISEDFRIELNTKKDKIFRTATVYMTSGQMDESDFKCYKCLERYLYQMINKYMDIFNDELQYIKGAGYIDVTVDSMRQFSINALGYSTTNSTETINRFFDRLTGLSITYGDNSDDTDNEDNTNKIGYSLKVSPTAKLRYRKTPYRPFGSMEMRGTKSKRIITIGLHRDYVLNLINGNCKLYYNEYSDKITKASSNYLYRLLIGRSKAKYSRIFYSYNELIQHLGIKRERFKSDAADQIGAIAKQINFDNGTRLLMYTNKANDNGVFSKNRPFVIMDRYNNGSWIFVFRLNIGASPDQLYYDSNDEWKEFIDNYHISRAATAIMITDAKSMGMTLDEYVMSGFAANMLSTASELSEKREELQNAVQMRENKKRKRERNNETYEEIKIGRSLKAAVGGIQPAKEKVKEIEAQVDKNTADTLASLKARVKENEKFKKRQAFSALHSGRKTEATLSNPMVKTAVSERAKTEIDDLFGLTRKSS